MGVEGIISILLAASAALGVFYTSIFQRRELRGKTRAEQDAISTKASNDALAIIQGGLGKEVERLASELKSLRAVVIEVRAELETTIAELAGMTGQRNDLMAENAKCHAEIEVLRAEAEELRRRIADLERRPDGGL